MWVLSFSYIQLALQCSVQTVPVFRSHLKILSVRRGTWSRFHNKDPQILGATIQYLVVMATWHTGYVHLLLYRCRSWDSPGSNYKHWSCGKSQWKCSSKAPLSPPWKWRLPVTSKNRFLITKAHAVTSEHQFILQITPCSNHMPSR